MFLLLSCAAFIDPQMSSAVSERIGHFKQKEYLTSYIGTEVEERVESDLQISSIKEKESLAKVIELLNDTRPSTYLIEEASLLGDSLLLFTLMNRDLIINNKYGTREVELLYNAASSINLLYHFSSIGDEEKRHKISLQNIAVSSLNNKDKILSLLDTTQVESLFFNAFTYDLTLEEELKAIRNLARLINSDAYVSCKALELLQAYVLKYIEDLSQLINNFNIMTKENAIDLIEAVNNGILGLANKGYPKALKQFINSQIYSKFYIIPKDIRELIYEFILSFAQNNTPRDTYREILDKVIATDSKEAANFLRAINAKVDLKSPLDINIQSLAGINNELKRRLEELLRTVYIDRDYVKYKKEKSEILSLINSTEQSDQDICKETISLIDRSLALSLILHMKDIDIDIPKAACMSGDLELAKEILKSPKDNLLKYCNSIAIAEYLFASSSYSEIDLALRKACVSGNINMVSFLLDKGANIEACSVGDSSKIMLSLNRLDVLKLLLDRGANINYTNYQGTALQRAIESNNEIAAMLLLERNPNINSAHFKGDTLLMIALANEMDKVAEKLIKISDKESINQKNIHNETALISAFKFNQKFVSLLLEHGADKQDFLTTAISKAVDNNDYELLELISDEFISEDINYDKFRLRDIQQISDKVMEMNKIPLLRKINKLYNAIYANMKSKH